MNSFLVDILGWIGSIALIAAYVSVSKNRITAQDPIYHILNLIGSVLLIINTVYYGALPSALVNVVWVGIGSYYLFKNTKNDEAVH